MAFIQPVIPGGSAGQSDFTFIFGIGRPENKGFMGLQNLNKQGNQFRGTVAYNNIFKIRIYIGGDTFSQGGIFSFRVAGDGVDAFSQSGAQLWRNADWIYIG